MAFTKMTNAELTAVDIHAGQTTQYLNEETGVFSNPAWEFIEVQINTAKTQFRRKYTRTIDNVLVTVFLISNKTNITGGSAFSKYEFYKETP